MSKNYRIGIVGVAHMHINNVAALFKDHPQAQLVACADTVPDRPELREGPYTRGWNLKHAMQKLGFARSYTDYREMLAKEKLDIVSVATWPDVHAQIVIDTAKYRPKGIFCEKPMANTWGECKRMVAAAVQNDVKLAFHHQRRYGKPFRLARKLIEEGAIGKLVRVEFGFANMFEYGSHNFDLCGYLAGCTKAKWAMGQVNYSKWEVVFDTHNENTAMATWEYENGVQGFCATGRCTSLVGAHNRAIGTDGLIEMGPADPAAKGKHLRIALRQEGLGVRQHRWRALSRPRLHRALHRRLREQHPRRQGQRGGGRQRPQRHRDHLRHLAFLAHSRRGRTAPAPEDNALVSMMNSGEVRPR